MTCAHGVNITQITVAATAVPPQRTQMVDISADGYAIGARLPGETARQRDSQTVEDQVKSIAAVELELDF